LHVRQHGGDAVDDAEDVDRDDVADLARVQTRARRRAAHPRVGDEHVNPAPVLADALGRGLHGLGVAHVGRQRQRLAARALDLIRDLEQLLAPPRRQTQTRPALTQLDRQRPPDA
jgi:hypothetical protein